MKTADLALPDPSPRYPAPRSSFAPRTRAVVFSALAFSLLASPGVAAPQAAKKAEDAKLAKLYAAWGLVEKDGRWQRTADLAQLEKGMIQHPETGAWIPKDGLAKAQQSQYLVKEEWVGLEDADKAHRTWRNPWKLYGDNVELHTNYELQTAKDILNQAESSVSFARNLLWDPTMPLPERVIIYAFKSSNSYQEFGANNDASGFSSHGAFQVTGEEDEGDRRRRRSRKQEVTKALPVAVYYGAKNWGPYYLKHGVGLGIATQLLKPLGVEERHWLMTGFGGYTARWTVSTDASHFGKQYLAKGGVRSLKSFGKKFTINGDMSAADLDWTIYQAGILVAYLTKSPAPKVQKAWDKVREAIRERDKKGNKAVASFEKAIFAQQKQLRSLLESMVKG